nr:hypothetical protein [Trinickia mobilis]
MSDDLDDPDEIRLESSRGYYLTKARNVLMDRMDRMDRMRKNSGRS